MKRTSWNVMAAGLIIAVLISNAGSFIRDGQKLDELRGSVLRLHILANSDSEEDQRLKLMVRDELLRRNIFADAEDLSEAERAAEERLEDIEAAAEEVLRRNGCGDTVRAELEDTVFDERVYGGITMPPGRYKALRVRIGRAEGHNWWCVMYPPLCLPAACDSEDKACIADNTEEEEEFFDEKELDILRKPRKYKVRFAIWDKIKSIIDE
ncbi:stage II sporulation protein R [Ruminococcus flavefaciens]|uniref:Stage II sporulation protein R n=1 Tax=Ruminococcus flavefaciens 007c TaxID=1341157 RepID=W7USI4_RUMFL|nr:stage II sporulation protein R [Ruminococcus flavefaciens]EWM54374.1 hypothetical protein RF007C_12250 [Ruminococcus flavefaciens 007c]